jgi:hypothetical protein
MGVPARVLGAGLAGCAVLAVAACGSSTAGSASGAASPAASPAGEPSARSLVSSMQTSVRSASSVHVAGKLSQSGTPLSIDLNLSRNGDMAGTITQDGASAQVVAVDSEIYVKATEAFLKEMKAPAGACGLVCGKWIRLSAQQAGQLTGDLSMRSLMAPLTSGQVPKLTAAGQATVAGQRTWVLRAADGSTLDVSTSSRHYPLEAANGGSPRQVVTYSQWNAVPAPAPPPASQILNVSGV